MINEKLNDIDKHYLLIGLGKCAFINDVIDEVEKTKPYSQNLTYAVAFRLLELLDDRLAKTYTKKELEYIQKADREKQQKQTDIAVLSKRYGQKRATKIYDNTFNHCFNKGYRKPNSLSQAIKIIGYDVYNDITSKMMKSKERG
ncbi:hypothetical protein GMA11_04335 [Granulicatella sp. zg-ZJ]|uniref:hypothetical protein n=1 Tax=Granulicatella sp. zg-ZJ TaxID=2678504 RepID=UPI0013D79AF0|nr:hypothetical protein [Granulicatella sp. zg-ZJ]NEW62617.1 hypothetical protein [Granulicatella sp. zg-ZJ]